MSSLVTEHYLNFRSEIQRWSHDYEGNVGPVLITFLQRQDSKHPHLKKHKKKGHENTPHGFVNDFWWFPSCPSFQPHVISRHSFLTWRDVSYGSRWRRNRTTKSLQRRNNSLKLEHSLGITCTVCISLWKPVTYSFYACCSPNLYVRMWPFKKPRWRYLFYTCQVEMLGESRPSLQSSRI